MPLSENRKASQHRYDISEKGRARWRRYSQTEKGKARYERYKDNGGLAENNARRMKVGGVYLGRVGFTKREREELLRHGKAQ